MQTHCREKHKQLAEKRKQLADFRACKQSNGLAGSLCGYGGGLGSSPALAPSGSTAAAKKSNAVRPVAVFSATPVDVPLDITSNPSEKR